MPDKKQISLTIDGTKIAVDEGTTIMEACEELGVFVPRLCYHPDLSLAGSCRVCIVEVKEMPYYMASCSVKVWEDMEVETTSPAVRRARRDILELLLDNHPKDCQTCERDGHCELQDLAYSLGVRQRHFEGRRKHFEPDSSSLSVIREPDKCILCGRCVRACAEIQGVYNLSQHGRGFRTVVGPAHLGEMDESVCIQCGQCINACPTAAFLEKRHTGQVWEALADPDKHVVVQTAPSIRAAIGEGFGFPPGTPASGKLVTSLRRLGFDAVFDTDFAADMTIVEEANEFVGRLENGPLPMITSCSPGWVSFMERFYPSLIPHASTCKSPMSMLSTLAKTYYAEKACIDPRNIYVVAVMPCVAKKYEAARPEHQAPAGYPYTDAVLTTRELIWMIRCHGIHFQNLPDDEFDAPLGLASGAGDIFGATGGVMEATLRAASKMITGRPPLRLQFTEVRAVEGLRETFVAIGEHNVRVGVANGLQNAKTLLDKVVAGKEKFDVIEVMACPGGCIGGGGQPYPPEDVKIMDPELLRLRTQALYTIDEGKTLRSSLDNPAVMEVYESFLGEPASRESPRTTTHQLQGETATRHTMSIATDNWREVEATAKEALTDELVAFIEKCRSGPEPDSQLIAVLHKVQHHYGYLAELQLDAVAQLMQIPAAKVAGVASFYHLFRLKPRGKHMISVCLGTACYVNGADRIAQRLSDELGISWGETSTDGLFTLEGSRCLGTCGLAPVLTVDDHVYGNVTPDQVPLILETYLKKSRES